jgi:glucokinase
VRSSLFPQSIRGKSSAMPRNKKSPSNEILLGIDLGGTKILAGAFDSSIRLLGSAKRPTLREVGPDGVTARIVETVTEALQTAGRSLHEVTGVGIGAPGPLDPDTGVVLTTPNLGWENFPLAAKLSEALGKPVFLDNDVKLAALGETRHGAAVGANSVVALWVGTGIGGGVLVGGRLVHGAGKNAAELGHMVVKANGPRCGCGVRGHLEALASRSSIERDLREAVAWGTKSRLERLVKKNKTRQIRSSELYRAYEKGDDLTRRLIHRAARYIGIGVGNMLNILSPERVVLGGGIFEAFGEDLLERIKTSARKNSFDVAFDACEIVIAKLGEEAGVIGAAELAKDKLGERRNAGR